MSELFAMKIAISNRTSSRPRAQLHLNEQLTAAEVDNNSQEHDSAFYITSTFLSLKSTRMSSGPRSQSSAHQRQTPADVLRALFQCSRPSVPAAQFYPAFLHALTVALRANIGCVWRLQAETFQVVAHRQLDQVGIRPETAAWTAHQLLLTGVLRERKPARFAPGEVSSRGTNPLSLEMFCVPISGGNGVQFVVEIMAAPPPSHLPQRKGRLARLNQLCEFFRDYLQSQELRLRAELAEAESRLKALVTRLNAVISSKELAVVAVNEGRQAIGCDRVSLGWMNGRQPQILSVSGHDSIDRKSNVIRALASLTRSATQSGQTLQTRFSTPDLTNTTPQQSIAKQQTESSGEMPEAYRTAVDSYPTADRPQHLLVIPIADAKGAGTARGALIVEHFHADLPPGSTHQRAMFVAEQTRLMLERLELIESVPFRSWWANPKRLRWSSRFRRSLLALTAIVAIVGLSQVPMSLRLPSDGELLAEARHAVFAPEGGVIREVHVDHGSRVQAGDLLLTLENLELSAQLRELTGELVNLRERQRSLEAQRTGTRLTEREQIELQSGLVEVASSVEHTDRQIKLLQQRLDRLQIVAPADGVITSWNVRQTLQHRTVLPGDHLVQEIEPDGRWTIELRIPEDRVGYVARHMTQLSSGESLKVEFVLATEPEHRYPGRLRSLGARTELTADGHIVRATVELDPDNMPPLRDGSEVKARLNCGTERAGFVLFRELIEVIQTYWWY